MVKWFPIIAGIVGLAWFWMGPEPEETGRSYRGGAIPVTIVQIEAQAFADQISAVGTLEAWESVDIRASVSQIVTALNFEDGDIADEGAVLAILKQDAERARFSELSASLIDAEREARRLENLVVKNQVAQTEVDRANTRVQVLEYQLEEVEARMRDRTIRAPFTGQLGLREISPGALVTSGTRITTLDDVSRMRLTFAVPATELGRIRVGQSLTAQSAAFSRSFEGVISAIDSRVDPATRSVQVRAEIANDEGELRPGLLMTTQIASNPRDAILVPEQALESQASVHSVWRVSGDTEAEKVTVEVGGRMPGFVEIIAGLELGDRIIVDGVGSLRMSPAKIRIQGS